MAKLQFSPWLVGLAAGIVAGALDAALIAIAEPGGSIWILAQAFLAWTLTGWVAVVTSSRLPAIAHGVVLTVVFNIPWFIQFSAATGQWDHLPPLVIMSAVFGAAFGAAKRLLARQPPGLRVEATRAAH